MGNKDVQIKDDILLQRAHMTTLQRQSELVNVE